MQILGSMISIMINEFSTRSLAKRKKSCHAGWQSLGGAGAFSFMAVLTEDRTRPQVAPWTDLHQARGELRA